VFDIPGFQSPHQYFPRTRQFASHSVVWWVSLSATVLDMLGIKQDKSLYSKSLFTLTLKECMEVQSKLPLTVNAVF
jgi:hypothetical protein